MVNSVIPVNRVRVKAHLRGHPRAILPSTSWRHSWPVCLTAGRQVPRSHRNLPIVCLQMQTETASSLDTMGHPEEEGGIETAPGRSSQGLTIPRGWLETRVLSGQVLFNRAGTKPTRGQPSSGWRQRTPWQVCQSGQTKPSPNRFGCVSVQWSGNKPIRRRPESVPLRFAVLGPYPRRQRIGDRRNHAKTSEQSHFRLALATLDVMERDQTHPAPGTSRPRLSD